MKKITIPLLMAVFYANACTPEVEKKNPAETSAPASIVVEEKTPVEVPLPTPTAAVDADSEEYLDSDSIRINGALPFKTTVETLLRQVGKPDQIQKDAVECGGYFEIDKGDFYMYGQSIFEVNGRKAVMLSIDFRSGKFRVSLGSHLRLDQATTLAVVGKVYPLAYQKVRDWHDVRDNKTYQVLTIGTTAASEDVWSLHFYEGRLATLEYFSPC